MKTKELDERTKDLFRAAYNSARNVSKDAWVNMVEFGNALKRKDPAFQPRDFGEENLSALVRRMNDGFDVRTDSNTPPVCYVRLKKPVLGPGPANAPVEAPQPAAQPRRQAMGKVHNIKHGFGFIIPDDGSNNIYFHSTEVVGCTIFDLRPGDIVEFEAGVNERGPCARKVKRLASKPDTPIV